MGLVREPLRQGTAKAGNPETNLTIHQKAREIRQNIIEQFGERDYARIMFYFDAKIPGKTKEERVEAVLKMVGLARDRRALKLTILWLEGAGLGDYLIEEV